MTVLGLLQASLDGRWGVHILAGSIGGGQCRFLGMVVRNSRSWVHLDKILPGVRGDELGQRINWMAFYTLPRIMGR
jgi:hypothetical protein